MDFHKALAKIYASNDVHDFAEWKGKVHDLHNAPSYTESMHHIEAHYPHPTSGSVRIGVWDKQEGKGWVQTAPEKRNA